jgi:thioesterase domain-containing protein
VAETQTRGPYLLGGYCLGGVIALEMARQLTAAGENVELVVMLDTYNENATSHSGSLIKLPVRFLQNLWFHFANILSLRWKDQGKFLREKIDIEVSRLRIRLLRRAFGRKTRDNYRHLLIKKVNDEAALQYVPRPYVGRVAIIRPKGHFLGLADRSLGWSEVVRDGLEVHELPVYPRGMLVEPFCQRLAETLKLCLQDR